MRMYRCTKCGSVGYRAFCQVVNETYVCRGCGMDESGLSFFKARIIKPWRAWKIFSRFSRGQS